MKLFITNAYRVGRLSLVALIATATVSGPVFAAERLVAQGLPPDDQIEESDDQGLPPDDQIEESDDQGLKSAPQTEPSGSQELVKPDTVSPNTVRLVKPGTVSPLDGSWRLSWTVFRDGYKQDHYWGRLFMRGDFGTMKVDAKLYGGRRIAADQDMELTRIRHRHNLFRLEGSNPRYRGTWKQHREYDPDTLLVKVAPNGSLSAQIHDDYGSRYPVKMAKDWRFDRVSR